MIRSQFERHQCKGSRILRAVNTQYKVLHYLSRSSLMHSCLSLNCRRILQQ